MTNLPVSFWRSVVIILLVALTTFATRAIPFILFPEGKKIPKAVQYLGKVLPTAVIGMLVVYCLKGVSFSSVSGFVPELISCIVVAVLYVWKRNTLTSI